MTRLDDLDQRIATIEARLAVLEGRTGPAVRFAGPWRDGQSYAAGTAVVRSGSLWLAAREAGAGEIPGLHDGDDEASDRSPWKLAAKRGADGKVSSDVERRLRVLENNR